MKNLIIKISAVCLLMTTSYSCSKMIDDAYQNPNADTRVPIEELLPQIISAMACNYAGHGPANDARYIGAYIQSWHYVATLSPYDRMGYVNSSGDVSQSTWRSHYYDMGQNLMKMIQWGQEEKKWDYVGVGKGIFAWSWLMLTDYYGDVILKEAFNTNLITFHFDEQKDVYEYVRQLCFEALENLNKTGDNVSAENLAKGDAYFYKGDVNKWKKFVYGVLARYHNHLSNKADYHADSVIYYCDKSIINTADDATVKFAATGISANSNFFGPLRGNFSSQSTGSPTAVRQGVFVTNLENGVNSAFPGVVDPRIWYHLRTNTNGTFVGVQLNKGQTVIAANDRPESFWGITQASSNTPANGAPSNDLNCRYIFRNNSEWPVITAGEVLFMKAEAALRSGNKGLALSAYKEAISQNIDMLTTRFNQNLPAGKAIDGPAKAAFLANPLVVPATEADMTLTKIMLQKYIAMFGWGVLETWGDMRRYHYTDIDQATGKQVYADFAPPAGNDLYEDNGGGTNYVYRMRPRYNSEYVWNALEMTRLGADKPDYHTKRMWFTEK